jgi:hypothetical protein
MTKIEIEVERRNSMASLRERRNITRREYEIERKRIDYQYSCRLESFERDGLPGSP